MNSCQTRQGNAVLVVHFTVKPFKQLYITNKMEHFSLKVGLSSSRERLEDWFTVLQL